MATSEATERRLREFGIPLLPPDSDKAVDVALTGCDGVSSSKDVVKGGKGAMLREKLTEAMKEAMRAKDQAALGTIRLILAKLKDVDIAARTEASREGVADDKILSMMQGMIKQRNESIILYDKGGRADLAEKEKAEIAVIERFLPQQMDETAVEVAVREAIAAAGATSIKDMGGVMAALKGKYAGQMDFAKASAAVKKALSA